MEWIKVSDRLPEQPFIDVILFEPDFGEEGVVETGSYRGKGVFNDSIGELQEGVVTHWMPLPPPPERPNK